MAISVPTTPAQPPQQTPVQTDTLGLRAGQVVEARVAGTGANGSTQLIIGGQLVDAALSVRLLPDTLIKLLVQGAGPNTRLTVLPQPSQEAAPATRLTVLPQPSSQGQEQQTTPAQARAAPQPPPQSVKADAPPAAVPAPARATLTAPAQGQAQTQPGATPQSGAPNARPTLVPAPVSQAPAQAATPRPQGATPQLQPAGAAPRLVTGSGPPAQLEPGTVLRVQLPGTGANARPVLVPLPNPKSANVSGQANAQYALPAANPLQQAVAQTVQNAVARQDSIAALFSSLAGLGEKLSSLPKSVAQAGAELLAGRINLDAKPLDGAGLRQALTRSGVLFENVLQKSGGQLLPQGDLKSALLNFRNELRLWLGGNAQAKSPAQQPPPPPMPGAHPRAGTPAGLPLPANLTRSETGARLLGQSEAALARMQLTQLSSLPDGVFRAEQGSARQAAELNMELALMSGGEMSVGQFQISRDGGKEADGKHDGEWKMRFSINFKQSGEVGATVTLRGGKTGVMLWAEREETAAVLQESQGELEESLAARGLEPGIIRCRHGTPPQAKRPVGAFMDDCS